MTAQTSDARGDQAKLVDYLRAIQADVARGARLRRQPRGRAMTRSESRRLARIASRCATCRGRRQERVARRAARQLGRRGCERGRRLRRDRLPPIARSSTANALEQPNRGADRPALSRGQIAARRAPASASAPGCCARSCPTDVSASIERPIAQLGTARNDRLEVAVRSSATAEDLAGRELRGAARDLSECTRRSRRCSTRVGAASRRCIPIGPSAIARTTASIS